MRVLLFGTYDTATHPRVATIAEGLAASGLDVAEVNAPLGLDTAARVDMLARPWTAPLLVLRLARRWTTLARAARRQPRPDVVVVGYLGHFDVHLARLVFPRRVPVVLDHLVGASDTGRDRRLDGGPRQFLLRLIDAAALRAASIIVVDTDEHLAALPPRHRGRGVVVPVGAPSAWAQAAPDPEPAPDPAAPLRVVFYGLYTPLQGTPVIGAALGLLAGEPVEATMIGTGQDEAQTKAAAAANPAVRWLDWVPAAELPAVVAGHDVALGIFSTGAKAQRVVPNKVFQSAAAGCAIVTSDTPPQRRMLGDAAVLVPPGDAGALAAALRRLAADRGEVARRRQRSRQLTAEQYAPAQIVAPLLRRLLPAGSTPLAHPPAAPAAPEGASGMASPRPTTAAPALARPDAVAPLAPNAWMRWDLVQRMLPGEVTDVLEVGCGQGAFGARLAQRYHYLGVEPDPTSFAVAQRRVAAVAPGGEVRNELVADLGAAQFDLVCAFEVLEHLEDDKAALTEWAARLRPGGWLMISVPAHQRRFAPWDELVGHFRRYDPPVLADLLASSGFGDIQVRQYGFPLVYATEAVRNRIAARRLGRAAAGSSVEERTAGSARQLQPDEGLRAAAIRYGVLPFRVLQRSFPERGTGLVALARLIS
jgi:SAM-dependent methyltransferase/glycosyltransferase involved in cell wall biosynthesis